MGTGSRKALSILIWKITGRESDKFLEDNLEGWMGSMREAKSLTGRATPLSPAKLTENEIPVKTLNMSHLLNGILLFIITFH